MLLLLLARSASMSHEHSAGRTRIRSECPARLSGKGNLSERHAAAGLMHNQVDLPFRHSGQSEIGAHLPYLIFLGNRSQLLLSILCSLPFPFSFIFLSGFVASSVKYCGFFSSLDSSPTNTCAPLLLCNVHSSFPFTLVYLQNHPQSFVHPCHQCLSFISPLIFFQPSY